MDDVIVWLNDLDSVGVTALATMVLAVLTAWYVVLTHRISKVARESAQAAKRSAQHAERAANTAERAVLGSVMPLVIIKWSETIADDASMNFNLVNIGRSTALNVVVRYDDHDDQLEALAPLGSEPGFRTLQADPSLVTIEYGDAIGNRYRTVCSPSARRDRPMYETSLWAADGWRQLKAT
jgi:hypothetical protein